MLKKWIYTKVQGAAFQQKRQENLITSGNVCMYYFLTSDWL